jgi:molecular chaperone IbpA
MTMLLLTLSAALVACAVGATPRNDGRRTWCPTRSYPCCSKEDMAMRTFDPTPLWRSTVGFDRLFDLDHGPAETKSLQVVSI